MLATEPLSKAVSDVESNVPAVNDSASSRTVCVQQLCSTKNESGFFQGVQWSPDGLCLLSAHEDASLRLYECRASDQDHMKLERVLCVREPEIVYGYDWYPLMNSSKPETCCIASTGRDQPVHLWDAFTGKLRTSYCCIDGADEIAAAASVAFEPNGVKLYCGLQKRVCVFDVSRPGREYEEWKTCPEDHDSGIPGIISSFAFNAEVVACGSYAGFIGLFNDKSGRLVASLPAQSRGVCQLQFSPCGNYLFSGGRCENALLCWDLRRLQAPIHRFERISANHQHIGFEICSNGRYVITGSQDGRILVYDVYEAALFPEGVEDTPACYSVHAHNDSLNGIALHPTETCLATASGQRHFGSLYEDDSDSDDDQESKSKPQAPENTIRLWSISLPE